LVLNTLQKRTKQVLSTACEYHADKKRTKNHVTLTIDL